MAVQHNAIVDPDIHEPKGIASAASGEILIADGAGSGSWQDIPYTSKAALGYILAGSNTTTISTADTPVDINVGTGFNDAFSDEFTVSNDGRITYIGTETRTFFVDFIVKGTSNSGTATFNFLVAKNASVIAGSEVGKSFTAATDDFISGFAVVSLAENEYVEIWVECAGATTNWDTTDLKIAVR